MMQKRIVKWGAFFVLILSTFFLYTVNLDGIPTSVHGDEGETALAALDILHGKTGVIGVGWYDLPLLSFVPHAVGMIIFGENIVGDRMGSVLFGLLILPIFFVFVKNMYNQRVSIIATILLATSHIWISLSRVGITYVQATFLVVCCLYFVTRGIKKNDYIHDLPTSYEPIFLTKPNLSADFSTLRFLSTQHTKISADVQSEKVLGTSTETSFSAEDKVYILYPYQEDTLRKLRNTYNGKSIDYQNNNKKTQFFIYKIKS